MIGLAISSYVHAVAWIAEDGGFFRREKLETDIQVMGGSAATMRSVIAGSTDIGIAGADAVIKADLAGAELVVVAGLVDRFYHRLIGGPGVTRLEDLRGKKIGLAFLGGPQDMAVQHALKSTKLRYGEDVQVLNLGRELNRMAALSKGEIHATTSQTPPSRLRELGFTVLADLPSSEVSFPYATIVVRRSDLERRRETVLAFLRGLCDGVAFYRRDRAASLAIISRHVHGSDTQTADDERYRIAGPSLITYPQMPAESGLQMVLDAIDTPESRAAKPSDFVDSSLLAALEREGHCGRAP